MPYFKKYTYINIMFVISHIKMIVIEIKQCNGLGLYHPTGCYNYSLLSILEALYNCHLLLNVNCRGIQL